jgi:uncharacterized protein
MATKSNKLFPPTFLKNVALVNDGQKAGRNLNLIERKKRIYLRFEKNKMNEQENTKVVQQAYQYFKSGNIEGVLSLISDDADWRLPKVENMPHSGTRKGLAQITEFFSILADVQDAKIFDPNQFIAQGDRVVALGHYLWLVKRTNREYESDFVHVFTVRDGKITGFDEYFDTTLATMAYQKAQTA